MIAKFSILILVLASLAAIGWYAAPDAARENARSFIPSFGREKKSDITTALRETVLGENPKERRRIVVEELQENIESIQYRMAIESGSVSEDELYAFILEASGEEEAERVAALVRDTSTDDLLSHMRQLVAELEGLAEKDALLYDIAEKALERLVKENDAECPVLCPANLPN